MMRLRAMTGYAKAATVIAVLFAGITLALLPGRLAEPPTQTFNDDAGEYHRCAANMLRTGMYSSDGIDPSNEREPGYSIFLASVYALTGVGNRAAIFVTQSLLFAVCALLLCDELRRRYSARAAAIALGFLLLSPAIFHLNLFAYRESVAGALFLLSLAFLLRWRRTSSPSFAIATGGVMGVLCLTYLPLLPVVLLLAGLQIFTRRWTHWLMICLLALAPLGGWAARNLAHPATANCALAGCDRSALAWYVRARQVTDLALLDPPRCLWAQYITRNLDGLPKACTFRVAQDIPKDAAPRDISSQAIATIRGNLPMHLWTSAFNVGEFHLPYVNGWGMLYNLAEAAATLALYLGILLGLPALRLRKHWIFLFSILATTALFALIDVEPRYRMPILGAYAALAGIGYDKVMKNGKLKVKNEFQ